MTERNYQMRLTDSGIAISCGNPTCAAATLIEEIGENGWRLGVEPGIGQVWLCPRCLA